MFNAAASKYLQSFIKSLLSNMKVITSLNLLTGIFILYVKVRFKLSL